MSSNPLTPSFRKVHTIPSDAAHPTVVQAIRDNDKSITDLNQAIRSLKSQITGTSSAAATSLTENVTAESIYEAGGVTGGAVNNQSGVTAYTTQQSDNAGFVVLNDASAIAVTLNSTLTIPYYVWIANYGAGAATLTPSSGTISYPGNLAASSMPLASGVAAYLEYDGSNWWGIPIAIGGGGGSGVTSLNSLTGTLSLVAGANIVVTPSGSNITIGEAVPYPTVVESVFSSGTRSTGYTWTSSALPVGCYRASVYMVVATLTAPGTFSATLGYTDAYGVQTDPLFSFDATTAGQWGEGDFVFYNATAGATPTITVAFAASGTYSPQAIVLERLG